MELTNNRKKELRAIGHHLKPIIMIAEKGLTESIHKEVDRALDDHELIKIKININNPAMRKTLATDICESHKAALVQSIGKMALICRRTKKPNAKLSNLLRPSKQSALS
ncbi:MAG: RNA-binding protein [Oceanicoccus sp.]|jgi:RNA-binding protein